MAGIRYSIVLPIYNEAAALPVLVKRLLGLLSELDGPAEVIFVDDGSSDTSGIFLDAYAKSDRRFRLIKLSRNFGHQIAISAGMDAARGEAVVIMDADLQDPPEVVHQMIDQWKHGFQVVYARRLSREGEGAFKRISADLFYRGLARLAAIDIPRNVGDFRLIDRVVLEAFKQMPERDRFVRGMFAWLGFRQTAVDFHRSARIAGETKYPFWKMLRLALHGVVSFSDAPLRLAIWLGLTVSALALLYGVYVIGLYLFHAQLVQGWTSTMVVVSFLCGANMLMTGIIGLYIGRIHSEVKRRPLYVVEKRTGFRDENSEAADASQRASEAA
jgi:glycosyltransferase involved in cell wall biosynthesis